MAQTDFLADFAYGSASPAPGCLPIALSIYADRAHLRAVMGEDAAAAGLTVCATGPLDCLLEGAARPLGDVVLVDCPQVDAQSLAALARLDLRAARSDARLIVSTSVDALDEVFACMDQSGPVFLVNPNRAERVIALGQVMAGFSAARLRELSDDDRLMLLRLSEQVGKIAGRIERLAPHDPVGTPAGDGGREQGGERSGRATAGHGAGLAVPPGIATAQGLPEPRVVRKVIRQRQLRARFFDADLFADPAWDMLLDLAAARMEGKRVSVTSLCIAASVPPTTALRWIGQMVEAGLFVRICDDSDRRRAFIELADKAVEALSAYFSEIALTAPAPV